MVLHSAGMPSSKSIFGKTLGGKARVTIQLSRLTDTVRAGMRRTKPAAINWRRVAPVSQA